jgi:nucleoside-diphosphate-sugar epimerase
MNTLVIGGGGYIGQVLSPRLAECGPVTVLDLFIYGRSDSAVALKSHGINVVEDDMRDVSVVDELVAQHDAVVHLGGFVGEPASDLDPELTVQTNFAAPVLAAEVVARHPRVRRFIFASTCSVYGVQEGVAHESADPHPVSLYASTKLAAERSVLATLSGRDVYALRLSTVFGPSPRQRLDSVVNRMSGMAARGEALRVDNGVAWRPFVHVMDVSEVITALLLAHEGQVAAGVYNVGSIAQTMTIPQLASIISAHCGVEALPSGSTGDGRSYRVSFEKIESALGEVCRRSVLQGVDELVEMVRRRGLHYNETRCDNYSGLREAIALGAVTATGHADMVRLSSDYAMEWSTT